jgi:YD repeat-containing protein
VATIRNAAFAKVAYSSFETVDHGGWTVEAGSQSATGYRSLSYNGQVTTVPIETSQTITYTYSITRTQGEPVELIFSLGSQEILRGLTLPSGSGTVTLTPGTWNVSLGFDTNVSSVDVDFSYTYTQHLSPTILSNDSKTGTNLLYLTSTNTISKANSPTGNYYLSFYEKEGTVNVGLSGASLLSTATQPATPDGFRHVTKLIQITSETNEIIITGSNVKIDELRLYPEGALMTTVCYDRAGRLQTETDVNLRSLFYEYDEWGRLKIIRDHDKNILQHREYKLANN